MHRATCFDEKQTGDARCLCTVIRTTSDHQTTEMHPELVDNGAYQQGYTSVETKLHPGNIQIFDLHAVDYIMSHRADRRIIIATATDTICDSL